MTATPIPNDWFARQKLTLILSGGPGIYQSVDFIRQLLAFHSLHLEIILTPSSRKYIPKDLLRALGIESVISIDFDLPDPDDTEIITSLVSNADACLDIRLDDSSISAQHEQIAAAINLADHSTTLKITDQPGRSDSAAYVFHGEWYPVVEWLASCLSRDQSWRGKHVLVTAGPTEEAIDPIRYITNHSSGKMGFAIARQAQLRGAEVTLITGPVTLETPVGVNRINVVTGEEMYRAARDHFDQTDIFFAAAAVEDMKPLDVQREKIKKQQRFQIECENAVDVLASLAKKKTHQYLVGFSVETENVVANSQKKLRTKSLNAIVVNNPREKGAAFKGDTNKVTLLSKDGSAEKLPLMSKDELAARLLKITREHLSDE